MTPRNDSIPPSSAAARGSVPPRGSAPPRGSVPPRASVPVAALAAALATQGCFAQSEYERPATQMVQQIALEDHRDADLPVAARGMWVWSTTKRLDEPNAAETILATCAKAGINEIYLSIGNGALKHPKFGALAKALYDAGIRVEALMGEADWYMPDNRHEMLAAIDAVAAMNAQIGGTIAAVHLDIEPHQIEANRSDHSFLPELAETLRIAREHAASAGMSTSADLPRFALDEEGALFASAVQRLFVMLYQLRDPSPSWLARQSAAVIEETYARGNPALRGRVVVALRVEDYGEGTHPMAAGLDAAHRAKSRYGGWAIHDEAKLRAALDPL